MVTEFARAHVLAKPWGVTDLRPFSSAIHDDDAIGEIWYERDGTADANSSLLLKLLFTSQPLSIQVHPDDAYARAMGERNGKTEAWYVLSATPDARIALGLKQHLTPQQLREAIDDGSISDLVVWKAVNVGDSFFVPAGTIHAIGAGLVIAEIQQRSDATFRIFDYGRQRELHVDRAVAVANAGPSNCQVKQVRLSPERVQVVADQHFIMERIELLPHSTWRLEVDRETWVLGIGGEAEAGLFNIASGDAAFVESARLDFHVGSAGFTALAAYTGGGTAPDLLKRLGNEGAFGRTPSTVIAPAGSSEAAANDCKPQGVDLI